MERIFKNSRYGENTMAKKVAFVIATIAIVAGLLAISTMIEIWLATKVLLHFGVTTIGTIVVGKFNGELFAVVYVVNVLQGINNYGKSERERKKRLTL